MKSIFFRSVSVFIIVWVLFIVGNALRAFFWGDMQEEWARRVGFATGIGIGNGFVAGIIASLIMMVVCVVRRDATKK